MAPDVFVIRGVPKLVNRGGKLEKRRIYKLWVERKVPDVVLEVTSRKTKKKDTVTLVGFGTFKVEKRKARKGRNTQTGEEIKIKAKKVPKFVAGKALKDAVS